MASEGRASAGQSGPNQGRCFFSCCWADCLFFFMPFADIIILHGCCRTCKRDTWPMGISHKAGQQKYQSSFCVFVCHPFLVRLTKSKSFPYQLPRANINLNAERHMKQRSTNVRVHNVCLYPCLVSRNKSKWFPYQLPRANIHLNTTIYQRKHPFPHEHHVALGEIRIPCNLEMWCQVLL